MPYSHPVRSQLGTLALTVLLTLTSGCGGDEPAGDGGASSASGKGGSEWSEPTEAEGSPDGSRAPPALVRSPEELLVALRTGVARGQGHADASFQRSVEDVASVLFDMSAQASEADLAGARAHMQVAAIAGEVSRWLAAEEGARAERQESHPTDVAIHDRFLEVAAGGPEAYAAWCREEAQKLLLDHREATYARLMGDK
jgi:hypothetical protein